MTADLEAQEVTLEPTGDPEAGDLDVLADERLESTADHDVPMYSSSDDGAEAPAWARAATVDLVEDEGAVVADEPPSRFEVESESEMLADETSDPVEVEGAVVEIETFRPRRGRERDVRPRDARRL